MFARLLKMVTKDPILDNWADVYGLKRGVYKRCWILKFKESDKDLRKRLLTAIRKLRELTRGTEK